MVVFVDLESEDDESLPPLAAGLASLRFNEQYRQMIQDSDRVTRSLEETCPSRIPKQLGERALFAAALTCYPYAETKYLVARPQLDADLYM